MITVLEDTTKMNEQETETTTPENNSRLYQKLIYDLFPRLRNSMMKEQFEYWEKDENKYLSESKNFISKSVL